MFLPSDAMRPLIRLPFDFNARVSMRQAMLHSEASRTDAAGLP